jgi:hypothetical protein
MDELDGVEGTTTLMTILALFFSSHLKGLWTMDATLARPTGPRLDYGQRLYDFAFYFLLIFYTFTPNGLERISGL